MMFLIDFSNHWRENLNDLPKELWAQDVIDFIENWNDENNTHFSIFTSGSTGQPKEITHSRKDMMESALRTNRFFGLDKDDLFFLCLPASKIGGRMMILRAILANGKLCCVKPSANPLNGISEKDALQFSLAAFTPMQVFEIIKSTNTYSKFFNIKHTIIGGGKIADKIIDQIQSSPNIIYETFGMTETISHIALREIAPNTKDYFEILPNVNIARNEENRLIVTLPNSEPIVTNDIVSELTENTFKWAGRIDDIINSGGLKFYTTEIEDKLLPYISTPFFITKTDDEKFGEVITIVVDKNAIISGILSILNKNLSNFERPKKMIVVAEIKYTESGKIKKDLKAYNTQEQQLLK